MLRRHEFEPSHEGMGKRDEALSRDEKVGLQIAEHVSDFETKIDADVAAFSEGGRKRSDPELQRISDQVVALSVRTKRALSERIGHWKKNPLFKASLIAAALHFPLTPQGRELVDVAESFLGLEQDEDGEKVLRTQSQEEMRATKARREAREAQIKPTEVTEVKTEFRTRMEQGQDLSYEEIYFAMERVNKVPNQDVEDGRQIAQQKIEKYAQVFGERIEPAELRGFVSEMYGQRDNHDEGQASVSTYFRTGKHNCVSFGRGELIVLEGIIAKLPQSERRRYSLSMTNQRQHQIATLTIRDGDKETRYLLEGNVKELPAGEEAAGMPSIPLEVLKRGLVAMRPLVVRAKEVSGVKSGPKLIFTSDEPVDDGIVIEGKLRGSDFVLQQAVEKEEGVLEVELLPPETVSTTVADVERIKQEILAQNEGRMAETSFSSIHTKELHSPTPEAVAALAGLDPIRTSLIITGDTATWDKEALRNLLKLPYRTTNLVDPSGNFLEVLQEVKRKTDPEGSLVITVPQTSPETLEILLKMVTPSDPDKGLLLGLAENFPLREEQIEVVTRSAQTHIRMSLFSQSGDYRFLKASEREIAAIKKTRPILSFDTVSLQDIFTHDASLMHSHKILWDTTYQMGTEGDLKNLYSLIQKSAPERTDLLEPMKRQLNGTPG